MNATTYAEEPSYTSNSTQGHDHYILIIGFFFMVFVLFIIVYAYYVLKHSRAPPEAYGHTDNHYLIAFSRGLDDDVLVTFPTFLYSDATVTHKVDTAIVDNYSGCSICLAEYKSTDIVRLMPDCGHLFHVMCIDTWLKAHPTCPVCRKSLLTGFEAPL